MPNQVTIKSNEKIVIYIPAGTLVSLHQLLSKVPSNDLTEATQLVETKKILESSVYPSLQDFLNRVVSGSKIPIGDKSGKETN